MKWLALAVSLVAMPALMTTASCDDDGDDGTGGGVVSDDLPTGDACTQNNQCPGGLCLDDETFASLTEGNSTANIPGGYCSMLQCTVGGTEQCGPDGFCYDLEAYVETPFSACFKTCDSEADCRDGYLCTDASQSPDYPPLPEKACLPSGSAVLAGRSTARVPGRHGRWRVPVAPAAPRVGSGGTGG